MCELGTINSPELVLAKKLQKKGYEFVEKMSSLWERAKSMCGLGTIILQNLVLAKKLQKKGYEFVQKMSSFLE